MQHEVEETEHLWIPMPDGVRLSARLWRPKGDPCPAILEYIPYRKRDMVRPRDARNHPYFAAHGYACLRVDMRGSGDSEGTMPDMYDPLELSDARHVIDWIAAQDWCSGRVGMFGTSWGGTTSLQAAVDAPKALAAVIANCATVDRFEDDIHWMGGCLLTDSLEWGATLPAILAAPPDSATVGPDWRAQWEARLQALTHPFEAWATHRERGSYWRHGSVRFAAERLSCPVLTIGGWADRYSNSVMRLVRARPDLCWGIVGPWGHHYPDKGEPGPGMGFQDLALAWWDHWLKDGPAPDWPQLRVWERGFDSPQDRLERRVGQWVTAPVDSGATRVFHLGASGLTDEPQDPVTRALPVHMAHGSCAGDTGYFGRVGGSPLDQTADDSLSLCLDSAPLASDVTLTGDTTFEITLDPGPHPGQLACRLCDVAPDGRSLLVTRTVRALRLDDDLDAALPAGPQRYRLTLPTTAHRFGAGHRIRLSLAGGYWPLVWPVAGTSAAQLDLSSARLTLQTPDTTPCPPPAPLPRDLPTAPDWTPLSDGPLTRDPATLRNGTLSSGWTQPMAGAHFPHLGLSLRTATSARYGIGTTAETATCTMTHEIEITRPDGTARITSDLKLTGGEARATLTATWNDTPVAKRDWTYPCP